MKPFNEKIFLELALPTEEEPVSDRQRILSALQEQGYDPVEFPVFVLQKLYPMCRDCDFRITVTVVYGGCLPRGSEL